MKLRLNGRRVLALVWAMFRSSRAVQAEGGVGRRWAMLLFDLSQPSDGGPMFKIYEAEKSLLYG